MGTRAEVGSCTRRVAVSLVEDAADAKRCQKMSKTSKMSRCQDANLVGWNQEPLGLRVYCRGRLERRLVSGGWDPMRRPPQIRCHSWPLQHGVVAGVRTRYGPRDTPYRNCEVQSMYSGLAWCRRQGELVGVDIGLIGD